MLLVGSARTSAVFRREKLTTKSVKSSPFVDTLIPAHTNNENTENGKNTLFIVTGLLTILIKLFLIFFYKFESDSIHSSIDNINIQAPTRSVSSDGSVSSQNLASGSTVMNIPHVPLSLPGQSDSQRFLTSPSKRGQRVVSIDEIIKKENDLELARKSIKKLQSQLGTVVLSEDSEHDSSISTDEVRDVHVEVEQNDSFFARNYTFKTNV